MRRMNQFPQILLFFQCSHRTATQEVFFIGELPQRSVAAALRLIVPCVVPVTLPLAACREWLFHSMKQMSGRNIRHFLENEQ